MAPDDVKALVEDELARVHQAPDPSFDIDEYDLERCRIDPPVRQAVALPHPVHEQVDMWIVYDDHPGEATACLVVFDPQHEGFGLALRSPAGLPVCFGYYGGFIDCLRGM